MLASITEQLLIAETTAAVAALKPATTDRCVTLRLDRLQGRQHTGSAQPVDQSV